MASSPEATAPVVTATEATTEEAEAAAATAAVVVAQVAATEVGTVDVAATSHRCGLGTVPDGAPPVVAASTACDIGGSALHDAATAGDMEAVVALLGDPAVATRVAAVDAAGETPLHRVAVAAAANVAAALVSAGAAVDAVDGDGQTALAVAADVGAAAVADVLLAAGAAAGAADEWTPLYVFAGRGHAPAVDALLAAGAAVAGAGAGGETPPSTAPRWGGTPLWWRRCSQRARRSTR